MKSDAVAKEVALAVERQERRDHNYPIIPLPIEGVRKRDIIPKALAHFQAYDLRNMANDKTVLPGFVENLKQRLPLYTGRQL